MKLKEVYVLITKQNILKTGIALMCLTMGIGILSGCSGNNRQESHPESNNSVQEELHVNVSSQENQNESSSESKTEEITQNEAIHLPNISPLNLFFSSGAGAWSTSIELNSDGSFEGSYRDSDMGVIGNGYPKGTAYVCEFSGKFSNMRQIDNTTYAITLSEINTKRAEGEEWIEDGVRYISSGPYGLEEGKEFLLYTPQTPVKNLTEEFIQWGYGSVGLDSSRETLGCYGLYNTEMGYGFFQINRLPKTKEGCKNF